MRSGRLRDILPPPTLFDVDCRRDLVDGDSDEGAGEPVDPDPGVLTVGANWRGSTPAMPMLKRFWSMKRMWDPANSTASDRNRRCIQIYPGSAPRRVKTYILLVWSCIIGICGAVTMVRRCNLAEVEEDGVASLYELGCLGGAHGGFIYAAS
jgi:hypothetical protein